MSRLPQAKTIDTQPGGDNVRTNSLRGDNVHVIAFEATLYVDGPYPNIGGDNVKVAVGESNINPYFGGDNLSISIPQPPCRASTNLLCAVHKRRQKAETRSKMKASRHPKCRQAD